MIFKNYCSFFPSIAQTGTILIAVLILIKKMENHSQSIHEEASSDSAGLIDNDFVLKLCKFLKFRGDFRIETSLWNIIIYMKNLRTIQYYRNIWFWLFCNYFEIHNIRLLDDEINGAVQTEKRGVPVEGKVNLFGTYFLICLVFLIVPLLYLITLYIFGLEHHNGPFSRKVWLIKPL